MLSYFGKMLLEKYARIRGKSTQYYRKLGVTIGERFQSGSRILWGTEPYLICIGNDVKITDCVKFITHDGGVHVLRNLYPDMKKCDVFGTITIGNNVFIGNDVILLPNSKIGNNVVIGAGSIVTGEIPDNSVAAGVPCKVISEIEDYYKKKKKNSLLTKNLSAEEKRKALEVR